MPKVNSSYLSLPLIGVLEPSYQLNDVVREVALHNLTTTTSESKKIDHSKISLFTLDNLIVDLQRHSSDYLNELIIPMIMIGIATLSGIAVYMVNKSYNNQIAQLKQDFVEGKLFKSWRDWNSQLQMLQEKLFPFTKNDLDGEIFNINQQKLMIFFIIGYLNVMFFFGLAEVCIESIENLVAKVEKNWAQFENPFVTKSQIIEDKETPLKITELTNEEDADKNFIDPLSKEIIPQNEVLHPRYIKIANQAFTLKTALNLLIQKKKDQNFIEIPARDFKIEQPQIDELVESISAVLGFDSKILQQKLKDPTSEDNKKILMDLIKDQNILDLKIRINDDLSFTIRDLLI